MKRYLSQNRGLWLVLSVLAGASCTDNPEMTEPVASADPSLATTAAPIAFYQLSGGDVHTCGITSDNRLYCWGNNGGGQLGDGTTTDRSAPTPIAPELRFRNVTTGWGS